MRTDFVHYRNFSEHFLCFKETSVYWLFWVNPNNLRAILINPRQALTLLYLLYSQRAITTFIRIIIRNSKITSCTCPSISYFLTEVFLFQWTALRTVPGSSCSIRQGIFVMIFVHDWNLELFNIKDLHLIKVSLPILKQIIFLMTFLSLG